MKTKRPIKKKREWEEFKKWIQAEFDKEFGGAE